MGALGTMLEQLSAPSIGLAEAMLKDITPHRFARQTAPGGTPIDSNHPAWCYGHLAIYPAKVLEICGLPSGGHTNPSGWEELFGAGSTCQDDPQGTIYPPMQQVTEHFFSGYRLLVGTLRETGDEHLLKPHTGSERMRERFPTILGACAFMLGSHIMMHLGQVSTWRRCEGLGSAM